MLNVTALLSYSHKHKKKRSNVTPLLASTLSLIHASCHRRVNQRLKDAWWLSVRQGTKSNDVKMPQDTFCTSFMTLFQDLLIIPALCDYAFVCLMLDNIPVYSKSPVLIPVHAKLHTNLTQLHCAHIVFLTLMR